MKAAIFLDFDGVLFDTAKEAYVVSLFALKRVSGIKEIDFNSREYALFHEFRYLIKSAWNYFFLLKLIRENIADNVSESEIPEHYGNYVKNAKKADYKDFERNYFDSRRILSEKYSNDWLKLNTAYDFLGMIRALLSERQNIFYVITTKDRATILQLLLTNGIDFNQDHVYDRTNYEAAGDKSLLIKGIMEREGIKKAIFVDDNFEHLSKCVGISGLTLLQPKWGYLASKNMAFDEKYILNKIKEYISCTE